MENETAIPIAANMQPAPPITRRRTSSSGSSSSHALDVVFEPSDSDDGLRNNYTDFDAQLVFKKSDFTKDRNWKRELWHILRGSATPIVPLLISVFWATAAVVISWGTSRNYEAHLKGECRWWCTPLAVDGDALSYVGFALFLLTSFRVSEAYSRYMEGVRVWTNIGGTITSFAKYVVQAFEPGVFHRGDQERILGFLVAFPVALKRELRGEKDLRELKGVLCAQDLSKLQNADSMPSYCLYVLSGYCMSAKAQEARLPQSFIVHLIGWIADLAGAADVCTQIKTMPAPYSYISHLNAFLTLWLFFLPFAIVESTGWGTILIVAFISYGILGVVANAAELEDPFGSDYNDLPLGRLARNIQDAVASTYHAARQEQDFVAHEVKDHQLRRSDSYWLRAEGAGRE